MTAAAIDVVLSGSFRKDEAGLRLAYEALVDAGCRVLSPDNVNPVRDHDGFVYMDGETRHTPEALESKHLDAIQRARFVWLHAPDGYVGPSAALEVGYAAACGVPVISDVARLPGLVIAAPNISAAVAWYRAVHHVVPTPAFRAFQHYYRRVAVQRGYATEDAQKCLMLMVEEVGELARALRNDAGLARHREIGASSETAHELADVLIYVFHMANVLKLDVATFLRDKELINAHRFEKAQRGWADGR